MQQTTTAKPKLIVIGHIEHAGDGLYGCTLAAGWSGSRPKAPDKADEIHPLLPWSWTKITKQMVFGLGADGKWNKVSYSVRLPADAAALDKLKSSAAARYAEATSVDWPDPSLGVDPKPLLVSNRSAPWTAQLIELSAAPYPVPQGLNLSFIFEADLSAYSRVAALPVLMQDLRSNKEMTFGDLTANASGSWVPYADLGALTFDVVGMSNIIPTAVPASDEWNPKTFSVSLSSLSTSDWQSNFLLRAPKLFSLVAFLHDLIISPPDKDFNPKWVATLLDAGLASLRDLVGLGTEVGPNAYFAEWQRTVGFPAPFLTQLRSTGYAQAFDGVPSPIVAWKALLADTLLSQKKAVILNTPGSAALKIPDVDLKTYNARLIGEFMAITAQLWDDGDTGTLHHDLMLAHWNKVLAAMTQGSDTFRASLRAAIPGRIDLDAWLDDLSGLFWPNILDHPEAGVSNPYLKRLSDLSMSFLLGRLGLDATAETPANAPLVWRTSPGGWLPSDAGDASAWRALKDTFKKKIAAWQLGITAGFTPDSVERSARNPQPVQLQFASFSKDRSGASSTDEDFFRAIRGVGVLCREKSTDPWYNVSRNALVDNTGNLIVDNPVGIAQRPSYVANLRRSLLAYDSAPTAGGNPLDRIAQLKEVMTPSEGVAVLEPLLSAGSHDAVSIPQLKYGRTFEFATFAVLNSGVVPPDLRAGDPRAVVATVTGNPSVVAKAKQIDYQRTTSVGSLRTPIVDALPQSEQSLPQIPAGTYPRARDLNWTSLWGPLRDAAARSEKDTTPLALLCPNEWIVPGSPARDRYSFAVRLPEVTWREWACWGAGLRYRRIGGLPQSGVDIPLDATFAQDREDIIADCYEAALPNVAQSREKPAFMPALDDPSLDRILMIELYQEVDGVLQSVKRDFLRIRSAEGNKGAAKYRSLGATFTCAHTIASSGFSTNPADRTVNVVVEQGQVCLLRIWACVPVEYQKPGAGFLEMFSSGTIPTASKVPYSGSEYYPVSPHDLILEAASAKLPAPTALYPWVRAGFRLNQAEPAKSAVFARLQPEFSVADPARPGAEFRTTPANPEYDVLYLGRAELQRQTWRWNGRPVPLHPLLRPVVPANFENAEKEWVAEVYGEVPDDRSLRCLMPIKKKDIPVESTALDRRGCRFFEFEEVLGSSAGTSKGDQDLRGAHYRFSVRAYSRYEPLLKFTPKISAVVYAHPVPPGKEVFYEPNSNEPSFLAWKNVLVPSRVKPSIPRIRFVAPGTDAYERAESGTGGAQASFNDIFYDECGLGESLEAEIDYVTFNKELHLQAGKDPLLMKPGDKPGLKVFEDPQKPPARIVLSFDDPHPKWKGPVGHFKDLDNGYARFLASSFIIPGPTLEDGGRDTRNWLLSVRFRKVLYTRVLPVAANPGAKNEMTEYTDKVMSGLKADKYASGLTDPYWLQLLPGFSKFDSEKDDSFRVAEVLIPNIDVATGSVTLTKGKGGAVVTLKPTDGPKGAFRLYALLSRQVYDFRGRFNEMMYVATLAQDGNRWLSPSHADWVKAIPPAEFSVSIIEVQLPTANIPAGAWPDDPENIWDAMGKVQRSATPDVSVSSPVRSSPLDAAGRIVRISEPARSLAPDGTRRALCELKESEL